MEPLKYYGYEASPFCKVGPSANCLKKTGKQFGIAANKCRVHAGLFGCEASPFCRVAHAPHEELHAFRLRVQSLHIIMTTRPLHVALARCCRAYIHPCVPAHASRPLQVVREKLSELEIPHLYVSTARGSPKRQQLLDKRGHFQVPYIEVRLPGAP